MEDTGMTTHKTGDQARSRNKAKPFLSAFLVILSSLIMFLTIPQAAAGDGATLEAVDIADLPGNQIQLRFKLSKPAEAPRSFTINDPARIVLDFPNTVNGLNTRTQAIGSGVAESLSVLEGQDRTRATLQLAKMVPFAVRTEGNTILLILEANGHAVNQTIAAAAKPAAANPAPSTLTNIDFRRGPQGQALVDIDLSDPSVTINIRQEAHQIIADFPGVTLSREQERRLDVTDFATPVNFVNALNKGRNAQITVQTTGRFDYMAYQTDQRYTIEIKPLQKDQIGPGSMKTKFVGETLSLDFQDVDVRAALYTIGDFNNKNMVVNDSVAGNLTLRLDRVPWDQALDIVLRLKGLAMREQGNVIYIAPAAEVAEREKLEVEARDQAPLRSELIQVNYAKAAELSTLLKSENASLLSARGQVSVDLRTNTLLIHDVEENISEIRRLITRLDVPVRQVMIDARVVIANDDFSRELGVRFGATARTGDASITGSLRGTDTLVAGDIVGAPFQNSIPSLADRLGVNLGTVNNPFGRLALALLGDDYLLDLELSALQVEGRGEILSNPRVITTDRYPALIKQGREIPFQTRTEDSVTTQFRDAVLELSVVPQITPDNRIIMDLRIKKDELGENVPSGLEGGFIPTIEKREVTTQVLVDNGETVVLGGVFERISRNDKDKVPFLADLPAIGRLFQRSFNQDQKLELLIFVTPRIITEGVPLR